VSTLKKGVPNFDRMDVAEVFEAVPHGPRSRLLRLRALIFDTATRLPEVGELEETLKWGEPSYLTKNKSGTTLAPGCSAIAVASVHTAEDTTNPPRIDVVFLLP
jgi:hypothetical protein